MSTIYTFPRPFRCFLIGDLSLTRQCGEQLIAAGHKITGLISSDGNVLQWAESAGLRTLPSADKESYRSFAAVEPFDYLFSIANGSIVPGEVLALASLGAINFHDGPLPEYAGFFTTTQALIRGEADHGITWHRMENRLDAGRIVKQVRFPLSQDETAFTLNAKCYEAALLSFTEMVTALAAGGAAEMDQDFSGRVYYSRYQRPWCACSINFRQSAGQLNAFARGLDFGPYANPFGTPVLFVGNRAALAPEIRMGNPAVAAPGTVIAIAPDGLTIAAAGSEIVLPRLLTPDGHPWPIAEAASALGLFAGLVIKAPEPELADEATVLASKISRHEPFWMERLSSLSPLEWSGRDGGTGTAVIDIPLPAHARGTASALAATLAFLARSTGELNFDLGFAAAIPASMSELFASMVPLRVAVDENKPFDDLRLAAANELETLENRGTYTRSLLMRSPELHGIHQRKAPRYPVVFDCANRFAGLPAGASLLISAGSETVRWIYDRSHCSDAEMRAWARRFETMIAAADPSTPVAALPYLDGAEIAYLVQNLNRTAGEFDRDATIPALFEKQVERTPQAPALTFEGQSLTYDELNRRSNQIAARLRLFGVGPESRVAVSMHRSLDLIAALLGVLKAGGAYVPLDPAYPPDRLAFVLEDCGAYVVVTRAEEAGRLPRREDLRILVMDAGQDLIESQSAANEDNGLTARNAAYVIYTSGSTGKPKGVVVEHSNAVNFFAGMDLELGPEPGVWLAVTSISFDISILELFWTLTRGFHVVLARESVPLEPSAPHGSHTVKPPAFSMFYFGNNADVPDPYRLLLEGARFADNNGFQAVWTPERHFHAFGGLYPNPALTTAALATMTRNVALRAGSVVVPLHHPARIAEEWALADNLSNGRVGISIAPGWNERDFLFAPENYKRAKQVMLETLETVRALWRGEAVRFVDGKGVESEIRTFPRPVQKDIPIWVTAAGNPETFRLAGSMGANLLTHLLGQTIEQLAGKIRIYRDARRQAGLDPESGCVTVMLHTLVGETTEGVRDAVREPMKNYLRSSVDLIRNSPWSFPVFAKHTEAGSKFDLNDLTAEEMEALLEHSFLRYFETSGLFGSVEQCAAIAMTVAGIGADEIACLIDFGVPAETAIDGLEYLNQVRLRCQERAPLQDYSLPSLMRRYRVTHFQCTPSMASMIAAVPAAGESLGDLRHMLVGGEALTPALSETLRQLTPAALHNMYGPTETTIWSTSHRFDAPGAPVSIGRPMLNTQIYLLDARCRPVAMGSTGEIYIGGDGVARGYLNRPDLTAERFVPDPFGPEPARLYRTGDLARYHTDGNLEFLGRADQQVKIRGYRIELTEIEAVLSGHPGVRDAAVVVNDDSLAAYVSPRNGAVPDDLDLRSFLEDRLPGYMVPSVFVGLDRLPRTPNGKIDRKGLPRPGTIARKPAASLAPPGNELESTIAAAFEKALAVDRVGIDENFFDLGAHSILIVQVRNQLQAVLPKPLSLISLFQYPTVRTLAAHLSQDALAEGASSVLAVQTDDRSQRRKEAMDRRLGLRGRPLRQ